MNRTSVRRALASLFLCLSIFAIGVKTADATHFLGGTLRWERDFTFVSATHNRYIVYFEANWRRSYPWAIAGANVGDLFDPGGYQITISGTAFSTAVTLPQTAIAVNVPEDWLIGQSVRTIEVPKTALPVTVNFTAGDRLSTLLEGNHDAAFQLRTIIPIGDLAASPASTALPRVYLQAGMAANMFLPTVVPSGAVINTIEFAPLTDSLLRIARPMGIAACTPVPLGSTTPVPACLACATTTSPFCSQGMTISGSQITWTPQVEGLYAVQFKITSKDAGNNALASIPVDMIFSVLASCPTCTPPVITPLPATVNVYVGNTLTLPVSASDANTSQTVSLAHTPLPPGATFTVLTSPPASTINAQLQWTPTISDLGPHTVCFQATDSTGLSSIGQACTSINVIEDQPPVLFCSAAPPVTAAVPIGALVNLTANSFDVEGAPVSVNWNIGSLTFATSSVPGSQTIAQPISAQTNFPIGTTVVTVTASDGPRTASCNITVTVNKIPQSIAFAGGGPISFGGPGLPLTGTATSGLGLVFEVLSGPGGIGPGNVLNATGVGAIEVRASQPGDQFYAEAASVIAFVTVNDTTAPVIAPHGNESAEAGAGAVAVVNYAPPSYTDDVSPGGVATCTQASGTQFPLGTTQVTCTATDAANNTATSTFNVVVSDTTAPSIATNPNISTIATGPGGATVNFPLPAASDIVDTSVSVVCVPGSGTVFGGGTTPVTCTATDDSNNSASSMFTVTITNSAPTISVPANITAEALSAAGASVLFTVTGNDFEDGPRTPNCAPWSPGATFPLGVTTVTCTVTDTVNVSTSASFTVTVQDTTAPVVAYAGNAGTYSVAQTVNITCAATDAVGVVSSTCTNVSGPAYSFGAGPHTFSAIASDAAGNTGSASTTFTVISTLQSLQQLVNAFCDDPGICNALNAKLTAAANANNANARAGQLGAFVNQVQAQAGKCLTPAEAAVLLQLVQAFY